MSKYLSTSEINTLIDHRRWFHQYPEIGYKEYITSNHIKDLLTSYGFQQIHRYAETGLSAFLPGRKGSPTILLRADIDALPIQEETGFPFESRHPGMMHACGHDAHISMMLAAARYFKDKENDLPGSILFVFQPAEEGLNGADLMISEGVMNQYPIDAVLGLHIWSFIPIGNIGLVAGPMMANCDHLEITIQGKGGHAALPHLSVDPILLGAQLIVAAQTLVSRKISPLEPAVLSLTTFHGGTAFNVIPDAVQLSGTARSYNPLVSIQIEKELEILVKSICEPQGASYTMAYRRLNLPVINDAALVEVLEKRLPKILGENQIIKDCRVMGGEDISSFFQKAPGCFIFIGARNPEIGADFPHHHPKFAIDESALSIGVDVLIESTYALMDHFDQHPTKR